MGDGHGLGPAVNAELAEDVLDVGRDRAGADHELSGDLRLPQALRQKSQHFSFSPRQLGANRVVTLRSRAGLATLASTVGSVYQKD